MNVYPHHVDNVASRFRFRLQYAEWAVRPYRSFYFSCKAVAKSYSSTQLIHRPITSYVYPAPAHALSSLFRLVISSLAEKALNVGGT